MPPRAVAQYERTRAERIFLVEGAGRTFRPRRVRGGLENKRATEIGTRGAHACALVHARNPDDGMTTRPLGTRCRKR